jgi:hypothetical protein
MKLYIRIKDGIPHEHPMLEENILSAFPNIDLNNLPHDWAEFKRIEVPIYGVYEVYVGTEYELDPATGVYQDKHTIREMTQSEKLAKQELTKTEWANGPISFFNSWSFNPDTCSYEPPVPRPERTDEDPIFLWYEAELKWVPKPTMPNDDKNYYLDVLDVVWKEIV